jgi:hypothetical protein
MDPEPEIVVHAPLPPPTDAGIGYDAEGESEERDPERTVVHPLDPDPYHVMLQAPEELLDDESRARLARAISEAGATSIHVALARSADVNSDLIQGLRQLGAESGAARIDVHASTE